MRRSRPGATAPAKANANSHQHDHLDCSEFATDGHPVRIEFRRRLASWGRKWGFDPQHPGDECWLTGWPADDRRGSMANVQGFA